MLLLKFKISLTLRQIWLTAELVGKQTGFYRHKLTWHHSFLLVLFHVCITVESEWSFFSDPVLWNIDIAIEIRSKITDNIFTKFSNRINKQSIPSYMIYEYMSYYRGANSLPSAACETIPRLILFSSLISAVIISVLFWTLPTKNSAVYKVTNLFSFALLADPHENFIYSSV